MMKYETPIMEIIYLDKQDDVITKSPQNTRKLAFDTYDEDSFQINIPDQ